MDTKRSGEKLKTVQYDDPKAAQWQDWCAGYVRVSTDAQAEEGYSIDAQSEAIEAQSIIIGTKRLKLYIDGGFSGSNIDRPAIKQLIEDCKQKKVTHCIVYKLDRLSRSQKDTLYIIEDVFNYHDVSFVSIKESLDTSSPMGRLMIGILSAFAQLERENIRERTRMGMLERVKEGYWPGGGRIPFGYDYDAEQGILVPNKDADTVRRIYDLYLEGYALYKIASLVGLKYERLAAQILNRRTNCGYIVYNGVEYKGRHRPIISEEVYQRALQLQRERGGKHISTGTKYLFTGLLVCGHCGAKMRYQKWGTKGVKLVCYSQQNTHPYLVRDADCPQEKLWAHEVEEVVMQALFSFNVHADEDAVKPSDTDVLSILDTQYDANAKKLRRLYALYAQAEDDILLESINKVKKDMDILAEQRKAETERGIISQRRSQLRVEISDLASAWAVMTDQEKKVLVGEVIESVVITDMDVRVNFRF